MSETISSMLLILILSFVAVYDFREHEIPNIAILFLFLISAGKVIFNSKYGNLVVFVIWTVFFLAIYIFSEKKGIYLLGEGDIKLLSVLSLYFGFDFLRVLILTCVSGFVAGFIAGIINKTYLKTYIPLAPFVLGASVLVEVVH